MNKKSWVSWTCVGAIVAALGVLASGCKKDDNPTGGGGGGTITALNFTTPNQTVNVPTTGGATRAKLTGGTLPYTITAAPTASVATASFSQDTLTITPVGGGTTSITVRDATSGTPNVVTIGITVTGGGGGGSYGSGTVTASSTAGALNLSGTGVWPAGAGPSVLAVYDTVSRALVILGYQQVSGPRYNYVLVQAGMSVVAAATYPIGQAAGFSVGYNADTSQTPNSYDATSGNIIVTSVTGSTVQGNYSGQAVLGGGQPIQFSGTFNVTYVRGISPVGGGGGGGGTIPVVAGSGTTPQYSWTGGSVQLIYVTRTATPETPVWAVICPGTNCIVSPARHGTVPTGTTEVYATERVLTAGVQYRVTVARTNGDIGYTDFTP